MASSPPAQEAEDKATPSGLKGILGVLGPGFITGASDDDPSGIGTYAQAGASLGYGILWTAWLTFPLMAAVQFICARIGLVSGQGLAAVLRRHYPRWLLYPMVSALVVANTLNAGADLGAMAAAINLLVPVPIPALVVPISLLILVIEIWGSYRIICRIFKWLAMSLLAYVATAFYSHPHWREVLWGALLPHLSLDKTYLMTVVALLGTTISPYLFFWQADEEVEEEIARGRKKLWQRVGATKAEMRYAAWDVNVGMLFSNLVMFFIMLATAATLHAAGKTDIQTAADAAAALRPLAGHAASLLFALGIIGTGFLAVPILTGSAAYAVAEMRGWNYGLNERPGQAKAFYGVIAASTIVGMLINFAGINPMKALFWTALINGFVAPPQLVVIMLVANNKEVMGDWVNGPALNILGWTTTALMFAAAVALVVL